MNGKILDVPNWTGDPIDDRTDDVPDNIVPISCDEKGARFEMSIEGFERPRLGKTTPFKPIDLENVLLTDSAQLHSGAGLLNRGHDINRLAVDLQEAFGD